MRSPLVLTLTLSLLACGDDDGGDVDGGGSNADASSPAADAAEPDAGGEADAAPADGGADAAPATGSATIRGTVDGETIEPLSAWYGLHPTANDFVLVMPESDVVCDLDGDEIDGKDAVIGFVCGAAEATTYAINVDPEAQCDPEAPHVFLLVEGIGGGFEFLAASGSVTVKTVDDSTIAGSFTADFGADGSLTGTFDAVVCAK